MEGTALWILIARQGCELGQQGQWPTSSQLAFPSSLAVDCSCHTGPPFPMASRTQCWVMLAPLDIPLDDRWHQRGAMMA